MAASSARSAVARRKGGPVAERARREVALRGHELDVEASRRDRSEGENRFETGHAATGDQDLRTRIRDHRTQPMPGDDGRARMEYVGAVREKPQIRTP